MQSLIRRPATEKQAPAVAQCCAKISLTVAGCHD